MPFSSDLPRRVHALFSRAMELAPTDRRVFAHEAAAGDRVLLARLLELIDAAARADAFLEIPAISLPADHTPPVPDAVGTYLVVGVLGVGGMATVYEAIQESPHRRVALKVLHRSIGHSDAYLRFRFETEVLARLQHPGIAQIYEAGAARLGQPELSPFFAMELINDALPITAYADRHTLDLRDRVRMFIAVVDAVHHGHLHGIIHRDLKPGNILVDRDGRAKVIDFGVARTTEARATSLTRAADSHQLIGTLNYMSPEQCSPGADIDSRTDVYALGVILYELACRQLPHQLADVPLPLAIQTILQSAPPRPVLGDRDLEAIILKAIAKSPDHRYDSASALSTDLRRWLEGEAIEARPPTALDQCRRFAHRNHALVVASAAVLTCIVLLAIVSTVFAVRLNSEVGRRRDAERQANGERDLARWNAYVAQIAGALAAAETGEFEQMRSRLVASAFQPRGWEWGFLSRLADRSVTTITAHDAMIMDFAVSDDWTCYATAAGDGQVRLWDASTGQSTATFDASDSGARVAAVAFMPDRLHVLSGDDAGIVRLLDRRDLSETAILAHMPAPVRTAQPLSGGRIAIAASDGTAQIVTLEPRTVRPLPLDQPGGIRGIEVAPGGSLLATFNDAGVVWVRDSDDLTVLHRFEFPGRVGQVRFSDDLRLLAATGESGRVLIWNLAEGAIERDAQVTQGINTVRSLAFSPDGSLLAAGLVHRGILILSIADGRIIGTLGGHTDAVSSLRFRPDNQLLVSTSWDRTIRTWRTSEFESSGGTVALRGHQDVVLAVAFSPDGVTVASVSRDGTLRIWNAELAAPIAALTLGGRVPTSLDYSANGLRIAVACADGTVVIIESASGRILNELPGNGGLAASVDFDPTGQRLAVGLEDGTIRVIDLRDPESALTIRGHTARVNSVRFSPSGLLVASGSRDHSVRLWHAASGAQLAAHDEHESDVFAVLFSADGRRLYTGSRDQTIRVWDVDTGARVATLAGHGQFVTSLTLNPDQTRLAAGSWFGKIVLFDTETLDQIASFHAHDAAIRGVAFSPDGRWLASGSYDKTLRLFDSSTREEADSATAEALAARDTADRILRSFLDSPQLDPDLLARRLREAGHDPDREPWIRTAILSVLSPLP